MRLNGERVQTDQHTCMYVTYFASSFVDIVAVDQISRFVAAGVAVHVRQIDVTQVIAASVLGIDWRRFHHIWSMIQLRLIVVLKKIHMFKRCSRVMGGKITFDMILWVDFGPFLATSPVDCDGVSCFRAVNDDNEKMESLKSMENICHDWIRKSLSANNLLVQIRIIGQFRIQIEIDVIRPTKTCCDTKKSISVNIAWSGCIKQIWGVVTV